MEWPKGPGICPGLLFLGFCFARGVPNLTGDAARHRHDWTDTIGRTIGAGTKKPLAIAASRRNRLRGGGVNPLSTGRGVPIWLSADSQGQGSAEEWVSGQPGCGGTANGFDRDERQRQARRNDGRSEYG